MKLATTEDTEDAEVKSFPEKMIPRVPRVLGGGDFVSVMDADETVRVRVRTPCW